MQFVTQTTFSLGWLVGLLNVLFCLKSMALENPSADFPPLAGERYELEIPATLDLANRMKLSLNALTRCVEGPDPTKFPAVRFKVQHFILLSHERPKTLRSLSLYGKGMLAARMARLVTGDQSRVEVDNDWRHSFLEFLQVDPAMHGPDAGRWLEWIAFNIRCEAGEDRAAWIRIAKQAVERLEEVAEPFNSAAWIVRGDTPAGGGFASLAEAKLELDRRGKERLESKKVPPRGWDATFMSWTIQGLAALYRETGDPNALRLAGRFAHYLKHHGKVISADGEFLAGHEHPWPVVHWHHSCLAAVACAEYGAAAGDGEYLAFADAAYQHGLSLGAREVGFAPEYCYGKYPRKQDYDNTEACCTSDLVLIALWLTAAQHADYWDDIDGFVRNQLAELQMTDTRWFYELPENRGRWKYPDDGVESYIGPLVGNYAGWATLNEWHKPELGCGIMNCCLGNCTRAMFYVWEQMVEHHDDVLKVHLLINHSSRWADVLSFLPYEGRITVKPKLACKSVRIRVPKWVSDENDLTVTHDGKQQDFRLDGRYLCIDEVNSGESITLTFAVPTQTVATTIGRLPYRLTFKGSTVVKIDPPGIRMPLYQRDHYLADEAPLQRVTRFIAKASPPMLEKKSYRDSGQLP